MKRYLLIIAISLFSYTNANAWYNYGEYKVMLKANPMIIKEYVYGLGSGLRFGVAKEICTPKNLKLNTENLISIINDYGKNYNVTDDELVVSMLYIGLKLMFPCK